VRLQGWLQRLLLVLRFKVGGLEVVVGWWDGDESVFCVSAKQATVAGGWHCCTSMCTWCITCGFERGVPTPVNGHNGCDGVWFVGAGQCLAMACPRAGAGRER
jgi:hypothetical protein